MSQFCGQWLRSGWGTGGAAKRRRVVLEDESSDEDDEVTTGNHQDNAMDVDDSSAAPSAKGVKSTLLFLQSIPSALMCLGIAASISLG